MPPSHEPLVSVDLWPEGAQAHDLCRATGLCRRCGASRQAIATGNRQPYCEPGVTGISWARAAERLRDNINQSFADALGATSGTLTVPLYRPGQPGGLTPDDDPPSAA